MKSLGCVLLGIVLLTSPAHALGHAKQIKAIQGYCEQVEAEFAGSSPAVFSGPDPWTVLDEVPAMMENQALALVYSDEFVPKWVFLRIAGPRGEGWSEDIDYYFRSDGSIAKRERHLQILPANMALIQTTFYERGKVLKTVTHHHPLGHGKQNVAAFNDEPAPDYMSVDDLPFRSEDDGETEFVSLRKGLIQIPNEVVHVF